MKKSIYTLLLLAGLTGMTSCEKDQPVYSEETCWLNFKEVNSTEIPSTDYSFVYAGSVTEDTVWLTVTTLGFVKDYDRSLAIEQELTGEDDAVAGTHYLAFDDESLKKYYCIPADSVSANIPIVLLRDASLKTKAVNLKISIKENENFKVGFERDRCRTVTISDKLTKPSKWDYDGLQYYIGIYTTGVHQFLIDASGEKWDDEYIESIASDYGYVEYLGNYFARELKRVNEERVAAGLDILREEDGVTPVEFILDSWW